MGLQEVSSRKKPCGLGKVMEVNVLSFGHRFPYDSFLMDCDGKKEVKEKVRREMPGAT